MPDHNEGKKSLRTIITFDPFLKMPEVQGKTDAEVGRLYGLSTETVKAMRRHDDVPFDTIQKICHKLQCQPGEILSAIVIEVIPPKAN